MLDDVTIGAHLGKLSSYPPQIKQYDKNTGKTACLFSSHLKDKNVCIQILGLFECVNDL